MKGIDLTKEYICDSCGAPLTIDEEHQVLVCKYCGVTRDYAYFFSEDSLFVGYSFLEAGNFKSALRSFAFILKRDPHNVLALRGMLFANFKIKGYKELNSPHLAVVPSEEKALADCIRKATEHHRKYFEYIKELIDLRKKVSELHLMVSELRKRDTTHTEYDYDITVEEKTVVGRLSFREVLHSIFFDNRGALLKSAMIMGFIDFVGIAGLAVTVSSRIEYQERLQQARRMGKLMADSYVSAGPIIFWIILIVLGIACGTPFMKFLFEVITRKKVANKVVKTARVVLDTEVRSKIDECYAEIRKSKARIKKIDGELSALDRDFKARQGY